MDDGYEIGYVEGGVYLVDPYSRGDDMRKVIIRKVYPGANSVEVDYSLNNRNRCDEIICVDKLDSIMVGKIGRMVTKGLFFKSEVFVQD